MGAVLLLLVLVSVFLITYVANHRTKAPIDIEKASACRSCSNHGCSNYKGGE